MEEKRRRVILYSPVQAKIESVLGKLMNILLRYPLPSPVQSRIQDLYDNLCETIPRYDFNTQSIVDPDSFDIFWKQWLVFRAEIIEHSTKSCLRFSRELMLEKMKLIRAIIERVSHYPPIKLPARREYDKCSSQIQQALDQLSETIFQQYDDDIDDEIQMHNLLPQRTKIRRIKTDFANKFAPYFLKSGQDIQISKKQQEQVIESINTMLDNINLLPKQRTEFDVIRMELSTAENRLIGYYPPGDDIDIPPIPLYNQDDDEDGERNYDNYEYDENIEEEEEEEEDIGDVSDNSPKSIGNIDQEPETQSSQIIPLDIDEEDFSLSVDSEEESESDAPPPLAYKYKRESNFKSQPSPFPVKKQELDIKSHVQDKPIHSKSATPIARSNAKPGLRSPIAPPSSLKSDSVEAPFNLVSLMTAPTPIKPLVFKDNIEMEAQFNTVSLTMGSSSSSDEMPVLRKRANTVGRIRKTAQIRPLERSEDSLDFILTSSDSPQNKITKPNQASSSPVIQNQDEDQELNLSNIEKPMTNGFPKPGLTSDSDSLEEGDDINSSKYEEIINKMKSDYEKQLSEIKEQLEDANQEKSRNYNLFESTQKELMQLRDDYNTILVQLEVSYEDNKEMTELNDTTKSENDSLKEDNKELKSRLSELQKVLLAMPQTDFSVDFPLPDMSKWELDDVEDEADEEQPTNEVKDDKSAQLTEALSKVDKLTNENKTLHDQLDTLVEENQKIREKLKFTLEKCLQPDDAALRTIRLYDDFIETYQDEIKRVLFLHKLTQPRSKKVTKDSDKKTESQFMFETFKAHQEKDEILEDNIRLQKKVTELENSIERLLKDRIDEGKIIISTDSLVNDLQYQKRQLEYNLTEDKKKIEELKQKILDIKTKDSTPNEEILNRITFDSQINHQEIVITAQKLKAKIVHMKNKIRNFKIQDGMNGKTFDSQMKNLKNELKLMHQSYEDILDWGYKQQVKFFNSEAKARINEFKFDTFRKSTSNPDFVIDDSLLEEIEQKIRENLKQNEELGWYENSFKALFAEVTKDDDPPPPPDLEPIEQFNAILAYIHK